MHGEAFFTSLVATHNMDVHGPMHFVAPTSRYDTLIVTNKTAIGSGAAMARLLVDSPGTYHLVLSCIFFCGCMEEQAAARICLCWEQELLLGQSKRNQVFFSCSCSIKPLMAADGMQVQGNGFLHKMVRHIVGAAIAVGKGKLSQQDIEGLLSQGLPPDMQTGGFRGWRVADACGLHKVNVEFQNGSMEF